MKCLILTSEMKIVTECPLYWTFKHIMYTNLMSWWFESTWTNQSALFWQHSLKTPSSLGFLQHLQVWRNTVLLPTPRSCAILGMENVMLMRLCRRSSDIISLCCPLAVSTTSTREDDGRLSPSCKSIRLKRLDTALRICCSTSKILPNVPIHD